MVDIQAEEAAFQKEVAQVEEWWTSPRWNGIKR